MFQHLTLQYDGQYNQGIEDVGVRQHTAVLAEVETNQEAYNAADNEQQAEEVELVDMFT